MIQWFQWFQWFPMRFSFTSKSRICFFFGKWNIVFFFRKRWFFFSKVRFFFILKVRFCCSLFRRKWDFFSFFSFFFWNSETGIYFKTEILIFFSILRGWDTEFSWNIVLTFFNPKVFCKNDVLKISINSPATALKSDSWEFSKIFSNSFFVERLWMAVSESFQKIYFVGAWKLDSLLTFDGEALLYSLSQLAIHKIS